MPALHFGCECRPGATLATEGNPSGQFAFGVTCFPPFDGATEWML